MGWEIEKDFPLASLVREAIYQVRKIRNPYNTFRTIFNNKPNNRFTREHENDRNCARFS